MKLKKRHVQCVKISSIVTVGMTAKPVALAAIPQWRILMCNVSSDPDPTSEIERFFDSRAPFHWNKMDVLRIMEEYKEAALSESAGPTNEPGFDEATEARWQKAIYEVCKEAVGPEHYSEIDGGGCDSGDALDFTLTEIRQALDFVRENSRSAPDREVRCPSCGSRERLLRMCVVENCGESHIEPTSFSSTHPKVICCDCWHSLAEAPSESAPAPEGGDVPKLETLISRARILWAEQKRHLADSPIDDAWIADFAASFAHTELSRRAKLPAPEGMGRDGLEKEITRLKLQYTVAECWWSDDTRRDSPEEEASENSLPVGTEFTLRAATYWDETFRVTKVPDENNDDYEVTEISRTREEFETYQEMQKRAEEAESKLAALAHPTSESGTTVKMPTAEDAIKTSGTDNSVTPADDLTADDNWCPDCGEPRELCLCTNFNFNWDARAKKVYWRTCSTCGGIDRSELAKAMKYAAEEYVKYLDRRKAESGRVEEQ